MKYFPLKSNNNKLLIITKNLHIEVNTNVHLINIVITKLSVTLVWKILQSLIYVT